MAESGFAAEALRSYINRIERLEEERAAIGSDIKEIYAEAKAVGFDTAIMREVIRIRKMDKADYQQKVAMLDLYLTALEVPEQDREKAHELLRDGPQDQQQASH